MDKRLLANISLLIASVLLFDIFAELVLFPSALSHMPKKLQGYVPTALFGFMQKTKKGIIPADYTAILGDSHALGMGDEWEGVKDWENKGFGLGYRLFSKTGRDYLILAQGGTGSLGSILRWPITIYENLNKTCFYRIRAPKRILICFYEGNDLDDNLHELKKRFRNEYDPGRIRDRDYFFDFIEKTVLENNYLSRQTANFHWYSNIFFSRTILNIIDSFRKGASGAKKPNNKLAQWGPGKVNRALVGNKEVRIPDYLQAPSLELTEKEADVAIYAFARSLDYLRIYFPEAKIFVAYIPSPLASYNIISKRVTIQTLWSRNHEYDADFVFKRSGFIADKIREETTRAGGVFIDTRAVVRNASEKRLIHGPLDWRHFNRYGYDALADAIIPYLK